MSTVFSRRPVLRSCSTVDRSQYALVTVISNEAGAVTDWISELWSASGEIKLLKLDGVMRATSPFNRSRSGKLSFQRTHTHAPTHKHMALLYQTTAVRIMNGVNPYGKMRMRTHANNQHTQTHRLYVNGQSQLILLICIKAQVGDSSCANSDQVIRTRFRLFYTVDLVVVSIEEKQHHQRQQEETKCSHKLSNEPVSSYKSS